MFESEREELDRERIITSTEDVADETATICVDERVLLRWEDV